MILFLQIPLLVILLLVAGFFASAETSLFSLTRIERRRIETRKPKTAQWVTNHLENPRRALITILIGNMIVHVLATAIVTLMAMRWWGSGGIGLTLFTFTLVLIVFGEVVPKILAVRFNEPIALGVARPLHLFSILIFPFRWVAREISSWILKFLTPVRTEKPDQLSEEELKTLVKIGEEDGVLDRQERDMIRKIIELGERSVKDIMTPRIDLAALDLEDSRETQEDLVRKKHFTHFPVYQGSIDNIVGILSVQEMMLHSDGSLASLIKEPLFIPETKRIDDVLAEFREKKANFAICVDEYGGTAGIVTMEDILEEIFGEFYDEYATIEKPIRRYGQGEYYVEAKIPLSDFNEYFEMELRAEEASTLGGYLLEKLGEVPTRGRVFQEPGVEFRIHDVLRKRQIRSVIVRIRR